MVKRSFTLFSNALDISQQHQQQKRVTILRCIFLTYRTKILKSAIPGKIVVSLQASLYYNLDAVFEKKNAPFCDLLYIDLQCCT